MKTSYSLALLLAWTLRTAVAEEAYEEELDLLVYAEEVASLRKSSPNVSILPVDAHRISVLEEQMNDVYTNTVRDTFGAKAAAAVPVLDSYSLYAAGDLLYWQAFEGGTDCSYKTNSADFPVSGESDSLDFSWRFGFRTELGYRSCHDHWNLALRYTWFFDKADTDVMATSPGYIIPLFYQYDVDAQATDLRSALRLHFHDADLSLQKSFFLSRRFALTSLAALRTSWISQKVSSSYTSPGSVLNLHGKNDFWGIGPKMGLSSKRFITSDWNIFGGFSGSLMYGEFDVANEVRENEVLRFDLPKKFHQIVPTVQGAIGLGWETSFLCNHYHIAINVAYEAQYWWRQNQWLSYLPTTAPTVILKRLGEDLGLRGLTVNTSFDF